MQGQQAAAVKRALGLSLVEYFLGSLHCEVKPIGQQRLSQKMQNPMDAFKICKMQHQLIEFLLERSFTII
jgi:hypothetical protein